ncbi:hypothetical protein EST38_g1606 [Candolleomyces aberdarensis]|uniref:Chromatin target of PRMT1 protein C-terminal domain-containing protein n=1 Tax=Candolleomyces aberdarensis TaxID=2316362 RepID=A0A4Q2DWM2_9AGAR|nr:hypothetical protein EST38_g1606 [Candolleomyces aberdarensis]
MDDIAPATMNTDEPTTTLSYDDTVPYEEQIAVDEPAGSSLANRIGKGKIYLLADAGAHAKRKPTDDVVGDDNEMMEDDLGLDPELRPNALLFTGPPITHLPTQRIFAYATHFEAHPLGLEWVSDTTCVLVFSNRSSARKAYGALQRSLDESPSVEDGSVTAKPIPVPLWPAEKQLSRTLERALGTKPAADQKENDERQTREEGLSAPLRMRWARKDDVKKKGARKESEFYKKHGSLAGKEVVNGRDIPNVAGGTGRKRQREDEPEDEEAQRQRLDRELDAFLEDRSDAEQQEPTEDDSRPASPPSKMRSDYITSDGRSRAQKESRDGHGRRRDGRRGRGKGNELSGLSLSERISAGPVADVSWGRDTKRRRGDGGNSGGGRRGRDARPQKTQQELDDELDAFLKAPSTS